jgi:predicted dehydrogenase
MNIAIIGFGGMGEAHYHKINSFNTANNEKLIVTGIFDIDKNKKDTAKYYKLHYYNNIIELLEDKNVDSVIIATPNDSHFEYVIQCAKHNKNIICEKPIAMNVDEINQMYNESEKNNVIFEVHQNRRWDSDYLIIKKAIQENLLGNISVIESSVTGSNGIPGNWRKKTAYGGGMMFDWGVHLIDQILLLNLGDIESIFCDYSYFYNEEVEDGFKLFLKYKNNIKVIITVDTNSFKNLSRWRISGENGGMEIKDWDLNGGITIVKNRFDKNLKGITAGNGFTKTMGIRSEETIKQLPLKKPENQDFEFYRNFIAACKGNEQPYVKKQLVMSTFELMEKAKYSALNNVVVKI